VAERGLGDRAEVELARFRWPVADPGEFLACQGVTDLGVARPHHADEAVLEQLAVREPAQAPVELGRDDQGVRLAALDHLRKALGQRLDPDEQVEIDPVAFLGSSSWRSSIAADDAQVGIYVSDPTCRQSSSFFAVFCPYCRHQGEVIVWIHLPASQGGLDVR
jgi:hypothetical protein